MGWSCTAQNITLFLFVIALRRRSQAMLKTIALTAKKTLAIDFYNDFNHNEFNFCLTFI